MHEKINLTYLLRWLLLSLILVLAFYLRFAGAKPGFPPYHSDEPMSYSSAFLIIKNRTLDPGRYDYPSVVPLMHAVSYLTSFIPARSLWEGQLFIPQASEETLYWGRYFTAFLGTLTVLVVYLIGKKIKNRWVGLAAAALLAFNYRHVLNSHLGLPDIPNGLMLSLSFLSTLYLLEKPTWRRYLLNGGLIGLFLSTKYQIFALFPFLVAHFYLKWDGVKGVKGIKEKTIELAKNLVDRRLLATLLVIPLVFVALNPYVFAHWQEALHQIQDVSLKYGTGRWKFYDFAYFYLFQVGIGQLAAVVILVGMIWLLRRDFRKWLLLMSAVLPFFFVLTFYTRGGFYVRNFVTIIPLLMVFGGWMIATLTQGVCLLNFQNSPSSLRSEPARSSKSRPKRDKLNLSSLAWLRQLKLSHPATPASARSLILGFLVLLVSWTPLTNSLILIQNYQDEYNFRKVLWFLENKIPEGAAIAAHSSVPFPPAKNFTRVNWETSDYFTLRELQEAGVDFAVTNSDWDSAHFYSWMGGGGPYENFGQAPLSWLANIFPALTLSEVYDYSVAEFVKPWQAPESNFSVVKVPSLPKVTSSELIKKFDFEDGWQDWRATGIYKQILSESSWSKNLGVSGTGALLIQAASTTNDGYFSSPRIEINPGDKILVRAKIKSQLGLEPKKKDGLLRVDLFEAGGSQTTHFASRLWGQPDWQMKEIYVKAPPAVSELTVGFMIDNFNSGGFLLDEVEVFRVETAKQLESYSELPYITPQMDIKLLVPKSML